MNISISFSNTGIGFIGENIEAEIDQAAWQINASDIRNIVMKKNFKNLFRRLRYILKQKRLITVQGIKERTSRINRARSRFNIVHPAN